MNINHYTSASGLEGILKKEHINLRATRFSHLNDSKEYRWIKDKIKDKEEDICNHLEIPSDPDVHTFPYVVCFSELSDDHLMWTLYGNQGKGYMLTFDYDEVAKFALDHNPDGYNPDHLQQIIYADDDDWEQKFRMNLRLFNEMEGICHSSDVDKACALMKRHIYAHENEIRYMRYVYDIMKVSCKDGKLIVDYDGEDYSNAKFRASSYGITPYIDIKMPKELLRRITVGYCYNFQSQRDALNLMLKSLDYNDVEIIQSQIIP